MKIETKCELCGEKIIKYTRKDKIVKHYFCSSKCQYEYRHLNNSKEIQCELCGKKIIRRNSHIKNKKKLFCSRKCKNIWKNENTTKIQLNCCQCNKQFSNYQYRVNANKFNFCSRKCYQEWKLENKFVYYKNYRFQAFQYFDKKCEICGFDKIKGILEVHHIDKNRKNNEKSNLIILCPNCHAIITRKLGEILNRKLKYFKKELTDV